MIVIPASVPLYGGYSISDPRDWRTQLVESLRESLYDYAFQSQSSRHICFYTLICRDHVPAQVVQVFDQNWSAHVQCVFRGYEQRDWMRDYLSLNDILISLDVEKGPIERFNNESKNLRFQPIHQAVAQAVLPIAEDLGDTDIHTRQIREHILWQSIDFAPHSVESVQLVASIMVQFVRRFLPTANEALCRWGEANDVYIEQLP